MFDPSKEERTYHRARHVVALAPCMRAGIIAKGIPADKISHIPNRCDLDVFNGASTARSPRDEFRWIGPWKLVLFTGNLGLVNGGVARPNRE